MKILSLFRKFFDPERPPKQMIEIFDKIAEIAFPRGNEQIAEEAEMLYAVLNKNISVSDLKGILIATKPLFYFKNFKRDGEIARLDKSMFEKRSKVIISEMNINLIHKFYENYFGFNSNSSKSLSSEKDISNILNHVNLYDQEGYCWGCVNFKDKIPFKITETGPKMIYQHLILCAVVSAKRNLSNEDRDIFSNITLLPEGEWTELHYNKFAFLFAVWIKYYNEKIYRTKPLNDMKIVLQDVIIDNDQVAKNQSLANLFNKCFVNDD
jgi:hypothetical protein